MISWIKLDIGILDDAKIKIIRSHPDGNSMVILWIGLLCLAMKSERLGIIEISYALPYTLDDLANQFNIEKKTVELGLALFRKYRMIDLLDDGAIEIINFSKHQQIEKIERNNELTRLRMIKYRARAKESNALVTRNTVTITPTDLDLDLDLDKDKHLAKDLAKDLDKEPKKKKSRPKGPTDYPTDFLSFWAAYPRKEKKQTALESWKKMNGTCPGITIILEKIDSMKKTDDWTRDNGRFIPQPATWINQKRWEDEGVVLEKKSSW